MNMVLSEDYLSSFEEENVEAYQLLLRIEIVLRESLKETYEDLFGQKWEQNLPPPILKEIHESQNKENRPQFEFKRMGSLYYLTLVKLLLIFIEKNKTVSPLRKKLGGTAFFSDLEKILQLRNAVAHSRPVTPHGLDTIRSTYQDMKNALGEDELKRLLAKKPDIGLSQGDAVKKILNNLQQALERLPDYPEEIVVPEEYAVAKNQYWWEDNSLAGFNTSVVDEVFSLFGRYNRLKRGVDSIQNSLNFIRDRNLKDEIEKAISELEKAN